jgi:replicative DNA helicase
MLMHLAARHKKDLTLSDEQAENVLISAILQGKVLNITANDFNDPDWVRAYRFIQKSREAGEKISSEALKHRLKISPGKLAALNNPTAEEIEVCARIVKERSVMRKLYTCMRNMFMGKGDINTSLNKTQDLIREYRSIGMKDTLVRAGDLLDEALCDLEWGILYGLPQIDAWTRGMHRGELIIIAGRPSVGKSSLAVQIAARVSLSAKVVFFSLEMKSINIVRKAACSLTGLTSDALMWDEEAHDKIKCMNLYVCDNLIQTVNAVYESALKFKESAGLDLVIIDYLQLLRNEGKYQTREQEISEITRQLKLMARELDVPVVALSQLSRDSEKRGGRPKLSDLRGSGSIEQDADCVFLIHKGTSTELILAKQRDGATGIIEVDFHKEISRFEEAGEVF